MILTYCLLLLLTAACKAVNEDLFVPGVPFADIGMSFDYARKQLGATILKGDTIVEKRPITFASTDYRLVTDFKDVSDVLDVSGSLSLDLTMGVGDLSLSGSGGYMSEDADRRDFAELLFTSKIRNNEYRAVSPTTQGRAECGSMTKEQRGTHVITGMTTGGDCIVSVKFWVTSSTVKRKIEAEASLGLELEAISVEAEAKFQKIDEEFRDKANVTVTTYCTAHFDTVPTNVVTAIRLVKEFLKLHREQNPAGVVKYLHLTPVSRISTCGVTETMTTAASDSLTAYQQQVITKLMDIKVAYKTLMTCADKYPLPEKTDKTALITGIRTLITTLRSLLITFAKIVETIDQFQPSISSFARLELDYKASGPGGVVPIENQLWRDRATLKCTDLAAAHTEYQGSVLKPEEARLPGTNCSDKWVHFKSGKISSYFYKSRPDDLQYCESVGHSALIFDTNPEMEKVISMEKLWIRSSNDASDKGLLGLHVFVSAPKAPTSPTNYEKMRLLFAYPNAEHLKGFGRIAELLEKGISWIDQSKYREYFRGQNIMWAPKKDEQRMEPFGTIVVGNVYPDRPINICGISMKVKVCSKK